jgi:hypothetical protein
LREYFATRDVFAPAMCPVDHNTRERGAYIGASNLVVNLPNPDLRNVGIADCQVPIGLGLFKLKLGDEIGPLQFPLSAQLTFQLAHIDFRTLQQGLLFGALQQKRPPVDSRYGFALLHNSARLRNHEKLPGDARGDLHFVAAVDAISVRSTSATCTTFAGICWANVGAASRQARIVTVFIVLGSLSIGDDSLSGRRSDFPAQWVCQAQDARHQDKCENGAYEHAADNDGGKSTVNL